MCREEERTDQFTTDFRRFAREKRVHLLGIAPIERFDGVPPEHQPASIFPEARLVVVAKCTTRGTLRGLEEDTHTESYGRYGLSWPADRVLAMATVSLATSATP